jgi:predicted Zn-dependent protease
MRKRCSRRAFAALAALLASLFGAGCAPISLTEEQQLGYQFSEQMRHELPLMRDRVVANYVQSMGRDLLRVAGPQPFEYRFYVVRNDEINAFAGPAGHIYVHTETILKARNASELAGVIAHEVGHVARRHIANNYNRQRNTQIGQQVLVAGASILGGGAVGQATGLSTSLAAAAYLNSFGREAEMEADAFAVEVLPKAGYDPRGLVTFFYTLVHEGGARSAGFLSSHPATQDRIEAANEAIAAQPGSGALRVDDGGKLEIIQRRLLLLQGSQR